MMEMKKWVLLIVICMMAAAAGCFAESAEIQPLTARELGEWADKVKAAALEEAPLNDPADESADMEDGIQFMYPFATVYANGTEMTADTRINVIETGEAENVAVRELTTGMTPWEVSALFPSDNPDMAGDRYGAVLYLCETGDDSLAYGRVFRDGQRISALEYGEIVPDGDGYRIASLTCLFAEGLMYETRAEGFSENPDALLTAEDREVFVAELKAANLRDEYIAVKSSRDGTTLTPFGAEDLAFSGLRFPEMKPEDLPDPKVQDLFDNEDGTWIMTVTGEDYEAVFRCGEDGSNAEAISFTITGEETEGPRGVRLGDMFHEDLQRFRFEGRGVDEEMNEVLYGEVDQVPRGTVQFAGDDGITMQYVTEISDGRKVELLLRYSLNRLCEIILFVTE